MLVGLHFKARSQPCTVPDETRDFTFKKSKSRCWVSFTQSPNFSHRIFRNTFQWALVNRFQWKKKKRFSHAPQLHFLPHTTNWLRVQHHRAFSRLREMQPRFTFAEPRSYRGKRLRFPFDIKLHQKSHQHWSNFSSTSFLTDFELQCSSSDFVFRERCGCGSVASLNLCLISHKFLKTWLS